MDTGTKVYLTLAIILTIIAVSFSIYMIIYVFKTGLIHEGSQGPVGLTGQDGDKGEKGPIGDRGVKGPQTLTYSMIPTNKLNEVVDPSPEVYWNYGAGVYTEYWKSKIINFEVQNTPENVVVTTIVNRQPYQHYVDAIKDEQASIVQLIYKNDNQFLRYALYHRDVVRWPNTPKWIV